MRTFPAHRLRRLRQNAAIRDLTAEFQITAHDLIMPYFILEGNNQRQEVSSMPEIERLSIDLILKELDNLCSLGLRAIALFPVTPHEKKDPTGSYALNENNLMCRAIRHIKSTFPDLLIIADVALDPYTDHGHDGLLDDTFKMRNDATIDILRQQSMIQAQAGADILAPSDMCDGRVGAIRHALEAQRLPDTMIMSYSAKYASGFYGPFRDAVGSSGAFKGDKKNYQMNYMNALEAMREIEMDISEGADMVIIKPGTFYLDIIQQATQKFNVPICAYQVSGEYAMIQFAAQQKFAPKINLIHESLIAFKRAGCSMILSYFTKYFLKNIY